LIDDESLEEDDNPVELMDHLKRELKQFKKAYQCQVVNTMGIVRKLRSVHRENKRL